MSAGRVRPFIGPLRVAIRRPRAGLRSLPPNAGGGRRRCPARVDPGVFEGWHTVCLDNCVLSDRDPFQGGVTLDLTPMVVSPVLRKVLKWFIREAVDELCRERKYVFNPHPVEISNASSSGEQAEVRREVPASGEKDSARERS